MKRHPFDAISLIAGALFTVLGIALFSGGIDFAAEGTRWMWPIGLIAVGLAVLATIRPDLKPEESPQEDEGQEST